MQLIIGVRGCWKYVEVKLVEGCLPSIGGRKVDDQNIEPALWFKVLVLENVCIDCSERVISWTVKSLSSHSLSPPHSGGFSTHLLSANDPPVSPTSTNDQLLSTSTTSLHSILSSPTLSPLRGASVAPGNHSLMAPHDGEVSLCTDDLQSLFELSEVLYRVNNSSSSSSPRSSRAATVERKSWIRLLHCYLLPLITLHHDDLESVHHAYTIHSHLLDSLDQRMLDTSEQTMKMKENLSNLRQQLLPRVKDWAQHKQCSHKFLSIVTSDLQLTEDNARAMIHSSQRNLELLTSPLSNDLAEKFRADMIKGEQLLLSTLELRSVLEGLMSTQDLGRGSYQEEQEGCWLIQHTYIQLHAQLAGLRTRSADLSRKKVLALSVREALEQTVYSLQHGRSTTGVDVGLLGGHSTDVLPESCESDKSGEYLTLKDKIEMLLHQSSSEVAKKHSSFCTELTNNWLPKNSTVRAVNKTELKDQRSSTNLQELAAFVKGHFEEIVQEVCNYFNSHQVEFVQQSWLCYERVFFELFSNDFMTLYQVHCSKHCEQLMVNALSASLIEPQHLNLHIGQVSLHLFSPRPFDEVVELYQHLTSMESTAAGHHDPLHRTSEEFKEYFGGVVSDITSLSLSFSPLDRLQLLTSAFRKLMASLSRMKLAPLVAQSLEEGSDSVDVSLAAVSCDEMLPMLVLVLLQLKPTLLSRLNLHCCFLSDYITPFLSPGWHGYSLAAFSSALHVLRNL